ncbi:MAG: AAA family ATPase [Myxococcales bacterium]|nr:AAA family ATPase [Myxococcales bacterium]
MHLREVMLRNWRSYRSAVFRFPAPTKNKRVLLVGAMNGRGKTSLLMALYLGLYGREAMPFLEGVRLGLSDEERTGSYRQLMQRIVHRSALGSESPLASVELVFEGGEEDERVVVTRTWRFTRGGNARDFDSPEGEEIRIEEDGRVQRPDSWKEANNRISDLLFPAHVMPCFFFDGEQAQARVEAAGGRALSDAINALFGTGLLSDLDESLRGYVTQQRSVVRRDGGEVKHSELDRRRADLEEVEARLATADTAAERVRHELDAAEQARRGKIAEFVQLTGDAAIDTRLLTQRRADLQRDETALQKSLCDGIADLALPIALRGLGTKVLKRLDGEIVRDRWVLAREEATARVDQIVGQALPEAGDPAVRPPLESSQRRTLEGRLRQALETAWAPAPSGCVSEFKYGFLGASDRTATAQRIRQRLAARREDVAVLATRWHTVRSQQRDLQRQLDSVPDVGPKLEELTRHLSDLDQRIRELNDARAKGEAEVRSLQVEAGEMRAAIGRMSNARERIEPIEERLSVAERVRAVICDTREKLVPVCKASLEEQCTHHLREMISNEYRRYRVEFDSDLQPVLVAEGGDRVYVTTLSGAQKRAFGLAFTLAVAEVSGEEAPLVIDTPVGNMDSEFRLRVLKYLARNAPGQVIFLSHNEEIYGEYATALAPYVRQKYLVQFETTGDGLGFSTVLEGQYFPPSQERG